jgi:hypothetical protein
MIHKENTDKLDYPKILKHFICEKQYKEDESTN